MPGAQTSLNKFGSKKFHLNAAEKTRTILNVTVEVTLVSFLGPFGLAVAANVEELTYYFIMTVTS